MEATNKKRMSTETMVLGAMLTALVVVLQMAGGFIRFGLFQISLVLIPIVIGAATCGVGMGAWLGLVFGFVVLFNGDAAPFLAVDIFGTVMTVLLKGTLCGLTAGLIYKALKAKNRYLAVIAAAVICPIVNTGVFLLGCVLFYMDTIMAWAGGESLGKFMVFGLGLINFPIELVINIILSPVVVRLLDIWNKHRTSKKI